MYILTIVDTYYGQIDTYFDNDIAILNKILSKELIKITDTDGNWHHLKNIDTNMSFIETEICNFELLETSPLYLMIYEGSLYGKPNYIIQLEEVIL